MHQQIRTVPAQSPANLEAFLTVLSDAGINIQSVGGSGIEAGGEFAFGLEDGEYERAMAVLQDAGYKPRLVDVDYCALTDEPGQLLQCVARIREKNAREGLVIHELNVGVPDAEGRIQVQVYSAAP